MQNSTIPLKEENAQLFYYPEVAEIYDIILEDFVRKQPNPGIVSGIPKALYYHTFEFQFKNYSVK